MQKFGTTTFAAGIAALMALGLASGTARAQDEADGVLVIKRADGSTLVRKPALTLEGSGEISLKPVQYSVTVGPLIHGSYTTEQVTTALKELRAFLTARGVADSDLREAATSGGSALSAAFDGPDAAMRFVEILGKSNAPLQIEATGYPKEVDEKALRTAALAKALEDATARRDLFAKTARPRELILLSMEEGSYQLNPARASITLENAKFNAAPNVALASVLGPKAAAWATMSATLRYGWKDEMGAAGVMRAVAPAKPTAKSAPKTTPKKTATKQR